MGLIGWLKGRSTLRPLQISPETPAVPARQPPSPSEKEAFKSPSLLADWINRTFLQPHPLEDDYKLLPDDQTRKSLNITFKQCERCVREYSLLRIVGVSTFVKEHYPDDFWLAFLNHIVPYLCLHMYGPSGAVHASYVAKAIEDYADASRLKDVDRCSKIYMSRVYDDSDNFYKLTLAGIGYISTEFIASTYEIFRNAYCQVTQGMSYESLKLITDAVEKAKKTKT